MNWITFSQFIFAIGTILLIRKVIINREILNGYDFVGSFLTWLAMTLVLIQFYEWEDWLGLGAGLMQWAFWLSVIVFVGKYKIKAIREYRRGERAVWRMFGAKNRKEFEKLCEKYKHNCEKVGGNPDGCPQKDTIFCHERCMVDLDEA